MMMVTRIFRGGVLAFSLMAWACLGGLAAAQSQDELDALTQQIQEQVRKIEQELLSAGQQIEDEQNALLEKLGQTHDQLQDERARNARLEARLQAMLGQGTPVSDAEVVAGDLATQPEGWGWMVVPPRRVGALGLIEAMDAVAATLPPGTESVAVLLPSDSPPDGVAAVAIVMEDGVTRLQLPTPLGEPLVLATLRIEGAALRWQWHALSPADLDGELRFLDTVLLRATYEARRAGVALHRYQAKPLELAVSYDATRSDQVTLRPELGPVQLKAGPAPAGWALLNTSGTQVSWVSLNRHVTVGVGRDGESVVIQSGAGVLGRLHAIERERGGWKRDMNRLPTADGATPIDRDRIRTELERLDTAEQELAALRTQLEAPAGVKESPAVALVDPATGVVLARLRVEGGLR